MSGMSAVKLRGPEKTITRAMREARIAYWVIIPFFVYIAIWNLLPLLLGVLMGFTEYNALTMPTWVGLRNYIRFFTQGDYLTLLWRQVWIGLICLSLNTVLSFLIALALNIKSRAKGFFRTSMYIPAIAAVSVTSAVFVSLLDPLTGGANRFLAGMGIDPITWNHSQFWMVFWVVVYFIWRAIGPATIIWLGGLQGIDPSLYEAAEVDGASAIKKVRYITLPGLRFVASYIILTGIIAVMQMFDIIMFLTAGNPFGQTDTLMFRIYRYGAVTFNLGMAGAAGTILGIVTLLFAVVYFKIVLHREAREDA
ncbi:MAG: sugar ABC transporter permease [Oscillospiraceae bacterium]|nr:sugar ABC transporter permease [Oscillospiraceae bacterium]MCL2278360.1 sugar ABC transporter permease [Oscillospiraceae bacterium]